MKEILPFLRYIWQRFNADNCRQNAAALTYMSLFAVVPLMTLIYTVFSSIPSFQSLGGQLQEMIFIHFLPSTGEEVEQYLWEFSQQARKLTWVGIAFLAATAFLMLKNIESAFNAIWRIEQHRKGLNGFLLYWAVLTLGPLLLGAGFAASTYLLSLSVFFDDADILGIGSEILKHLPFLMISATFTLLFTAVPNCRVPFKHALIGGVITALSFQLAKFLFTALIQYSSYQMVYGAFAAIPLFLIWIYLGWVLLLAGAQLVYGLAHYSSESDPDSGNQLILIELLLWLSQKQREGLTLSQKEILQNHWHDGHRINPGQWEKLSKLAIENNLILNTETGRITLGQDLHTLKLSQILHILPINSRQESSNQAHKQEPWIAELYKLLDERHRQSQKILDITLPELFEKDFYDNK